MTTTTTDAILDALLAAVSESPEDWPRRLIAADRAEEIGEDVLAECLRWSERGRKAFISNPVWYDYDLTPDTSCGADLPHAVCECLLVEANPYSEFGSRRYDTRADAFRDLYQAYARARAAGWSPDA